MSDITALLGRLHAFKVARWAGYGEPDDREPVEALNDAHVTSSWVKRTFALQPEDPKMGAHILAIDVDLPTTLVESSTPGHYHLYIDHEMPWYTYKNLLAALADAGIIEYGYYEASIERGHSDLRLPWVKKGEAIPPAPTAADHETTPF